MSADVGVVRALVSVQPAETVADLRAENRLLRAELKVVETERDNLIREQEAVLEQVIQCLELLEARS